MKKASSNPKLIKTNGLSKNSLGVSEAVGTILMLAIAITLVAAVAAWVQTVPELPEQKKVNFDITYDQEDINTITINIEHLGGDKLDIYYTSIQVSEIYPKFNNYIFDLSKTDEADLIDGTWAIGEHWNHTFTGISENSEINIKIIDNDNDRTIFDEDLLLGKIIENLPDLEISSDNITFSYEGDLLTKNKPVTINAIIYNRGNANATALVRFFDDNRLITAGGVEYVSIHVPYKYSASAANYRLITMNWLPDRWGLHIINVKIYSTEFETNYANNYAEKEAEVEISVDPPKGPDLAIRPYDIQPSNQYPIHGADLNISIVIHNFGDLPVRPGENFNVTITLGNRSTTRFFTNGLRSRDSYNFFVLFEEIGPGGQTRISVEIDPENNIIEISKLNNLADKDIQILPTILIVDDDNADSGKFNVANALMKSFTGRGISYDYYNVKGSDDVYPKYNSGPKKLKNFDIVIWASGYETENTLTNTNIQNLKTWLDDQSVPASLWLIGQDMVNSTVALPGTITTPDFAYQYLGLQNYSWNGTPEILEGVPGDPITDGMILNTSGYISGMDRGLNLTVRSSTVNDSIYPILRNEVAMGSGKCNAIRYQNHSANYKIVYFGFEFTSISSPYDLSNVTYHVLKWFNYSIAEGYDFGIVDQTFSTFTPDFMDTITIGATIVNNGPNDEEVEVMFFVTGKTGIEQELIEYPDYVENPQRVMIPGHGGKIVVEKEWLATSIGEHNFRVMVDPFDQFQEVVEENNDFAYYGLEVTKLQIQYTILVVNDDNSSDNGGIYSDAVTPITNSLDDMGYYYVNNTVIGGVNPEDGPDLDILKHYNTVIWLTGNDPGPTLTSTDQQTLIDYIEGNYVEAIYLETKVNLFLVGQNILDDINGSGINVIPGNGFIKDYLKIEQYSTGIGLGNRVEGITYNPITHGLNYPLEKTFSDNADILITSNKERYLFYENELLNQHNAIHYEHEFNHSRIAFLSWELSFINNTDLLTAPSENYLNEFNYLMLNWFEYPGRNVELKITSIDINISEDNPNIGDSYIIKADVKNYGNVDSSTIVRFFDGSIIIDTDTIYISPQGTSTAEIIWNPRFAGNRTLTVSVDMDDDVIEKFNVLNNNATLPNTWVYFFYDDMEYGPGNWHHDSTITRINGESTLDFINKPVHSAINGTWNWSDSSGFAFNETEYFSYNGTFYTLEPKGSIKIPLDIVLALDTSGSMSQEINDLRTAARNFVNHPMLDAQDRVAIYAFNDENPIRRRDFTVCDEAGKTALTTTINGLTANGVTPLWDTIGEAINYANSSGSTRTPIIIAMTDGEDYGYQGLEDGSETYCPWHNWSNGEIRYNNVDSTNGHDHYGRYGSWQWLNLDDEYRYGLLNCTLMKIYTVGLGLEHDNNSASATSRFPNGWMGEYAEDSLGSGYSSVIYDESGTTEFNLWRVANTSGGEYFYANEASKLSNIFLNIANTITVPGTTSRGSTDSSDNINSARSYLPDNNPCRSIRSRDIIYSEGFETGDFSNGPWSAQSRWRVLGTNQHNGTYYAEGQGQNGGITRTLTLTNDLDLSGYDNVHLILWQYTQWVENSDYMRIDVSTNSGTDWTNVQQWLGNQIEDNSGTYHEYYLDLSSYDDTSTFRFRFRFTMNRNNEYWCIDDILLIGDKIPTGVDDTKLFKPGDRNLTTFTFDLDNASSATISFYQKYNLNIGKNGVVVLIGTPSGTSGEWMYEYTHPKQPYTGNFDLGKKRFDDYGNRMIWAWNGISGNNLYGWDYIEVSLDNWTGLSEVRVRISMLWSNWGFGGAYMVDNFEIKVNHADDMPMSPNSSDQWQLTNSDSFRGNYSWWNGNPLTNNLSGGLDNSLYSRPIDLTNARNATLSAYFKFNINTEAGRPPDGFRVEVSENNGESWKAINFGVRSAWGVSGTGTDASDGVPGDGKSYTGLDSGNGWVSASSLTRLNCDLTGWSGNVILIRFRVITASDTNPYFGGTHYESATADYGGFYVDDVIIYGFSLLE